MIVKPIEIKTPDGLADGFALYPSEDGRFPAVLFYMDGIGLRPALVELAKNVAAQGYYVLLPNLFYRNGQAPVMDYEAFLRGEKQEEIMGQLMGMIKSVTPATVASDTNAYLDFLSAQPQALTAKIAATGYCMGGSMALRAAAAHPDRIVAAATFHGGNLATEDPTSPHLLASQIKAELYVGHAKDDQSCPQEQVDRLEAALNAAGVHHQTEIYEAAHGWTMPDLPWAKNEAAAAKAWEQLYKLLNRTLKPVEAR